MESRSCERGMVRGMKFWEAMYELEQGKKVRCKNWPKSWYANRQGCVVEGLECNIYLDREWELYEEHEQTLSFAEMVKGLKAGKTFTRKNLNAPICLFKGKFCYSMLGDLVHAITLEDLESTDWVEVR
jgi:hypothetical protein